ncbi:hypothetical protein NMA58_07890 [Rhizobium sp. YTUHZ045]|uniref:hypothetical protein n=1 Tax=Rhizobium sp. YTUHZ045 TaxID=2962888 RepID=UPI003DA86A57
MFLEEITSALDEKMAQIGFIKVSKFLYCRSNDGETESFVEWNLFGRPVNNLACDFGLRNIAAFSFAEKCLKHYGGRNSRVEGRFNERCQLGQYYSWGERSSLRLSDHGGNLELVLEKAQADIHRFDRELGGFLISKDKLCDLLISDYKWMPWDWCNGAARAAEYAYLASSIGGTSPGVIRAALRPYENVNIRSGLDRSVEVREYLDNVFRDLGAIST